MPSFAFQLNSDIDVAALAAEFLENGRVQIPNIFSSETALGLSDLLQTQTNWRVAWRAGIKGPFHSEMSGDSVRARSELSIAQKMSYESARQNEYSFIFGSYPILQAYLENWDAESNYNYILEHINDRPFLDLIRSVTSCPELIKADAQATFFGPGHFLSLHDDSHMNQRWRFAYVINMCPIDWRPDWGGYLNFFDDRGDIVVGWKPRFNTLNLFAVPQPHHVSYVTPFAPMARFAITGWFRDQ